MKVTFPPDNQIPLNTYLGSDQATWKASPLGQINAINSNIWLQPLNFYQISQSANVHGVKYAWQCVGIEERQEDEQTLHVICHAQDTDGNWQHLSDARIGVWWSGVKNVKSAGELGLKWTPIHTAFYAPYPAQIDLFETGGYEVFVISEEYASETVHCGLIKTHSQSKNPHTSLLLYFKLMPVADDYPVGG